MVLEKLKHYEKYMPIVKDLKAAVELVKRASDMGEGKYEIAGFTVLVQEGETKNVNDGDFEAHKKFVDLQYVAEGSEVVVWAKTDELEMATAYSESADKAYYRGEGTPVEVKSGNFYILFPDDAHKACCHVRSKTKYKKVVIKCPVEEE